MGLLWFRSILAASCDLCDLSAVPEEAPLANPASASVSASHNGTSQYSINPDQLAKRVAVGGTPEVTFDRFGSEKTRVKRKRTQTYTNTSWQEVGRPFGSSPAELEAAHCRRSLQLALASVSRAWIHALRAEDLLQAVGGTQAAGGSMCFSGTLAVVSSGQTEKISRQEDAKLSSHSKRLLSPARTILVFCV